MKKFIFSMKSLLKIKISLEKQLKNKYAEAVQFYNICIEEEKALEKLKNGLRNNMYNNEVEISPSDMEAFNRYYKSLEEKQVMQKLKSDKAYNEVELVRKELLEITSEKKMLEKMKEKQYEKYLYDLVKEQEKEMDDILSFKTTMA